MPIPQFHRTPKTRKRRSRHAPAIEHFQASQSDVSEHRPPPVPAVELDENCALLQQSANDEAPSPADDVPVLLSSWPPRPCE